MKFKQLLSIGYSLQPFPQVSALRIPAHKEQFSPRQDFFEKSPLFSNEAEVFRVFNADNGHIRTGTKKLII